MCVHMKTAMSTEIFRESDNLNTIPVESAYWIISDSSTDKKENTMSLSPKEAQP